MNDRTIKRLLAISLALNVFVFGAAVGGAVMWHLHQPEKFAAARSGLRFAAEELPPDTRKAFRQALAAARLQSSADIEAARAGRAAVADLLVKHPLDSAAIETELAKVRTADMALRERLEKAVIDFAAKLPADERQAFVEGLRGRSAMLRRAPRQKN